MNVRKIVLMSTAGLIVTAGMMSAPAAIASTSSGQHSAASQAARESVRMWEDPGRSGELYVDTTPAECPSAGCDIDGWDGDNEISSVENNTGCTVRLFADDGFNGRTVDLQPHTYYPNLEQQGFDNEAEGYRFLC